MLKDRFKSFRYAFRGIFFLLRDTPNARIHALAAVMVILAGFYFGINGLEWAIVILCIAGVFVAEALNSAIEDLTDLVSPDQHPVAGKVKDIAAGAVLIMAIGSALAGIVIFLPKILIFLAL